MRSPLKVSLLDICIAIVSHARRSRYLGARSEQVAGLDDDGLVE